MGLFNQSIEKLNYDFECTSGIDYRLILIQRIKGSMFNLLFSKMTNHASMLPTEKKDEYEVPEKYYNLIYSTAGQNYKEIKAQLFKDKIEIKEGKIKKATMRKIGQDWEFRIKVEGEYHDTD